MIILIKYLQVMLYLILCKIFNIYKMGFCIYNKVISVFIVLFLENFKTIIHNLIQD